MQFIYKINQDIERYRYKIIYGSGVGAIELYMKIAEQGGYIDFFCDKETFMIGKKLLNKEIIAPEQVAELGNDACLIVCKEYDSDILDEFESLQIRNIYV